MIIFVRYYATTTIIIPRYRREFSRIVMLVCRANTSPLPPPCDRLPYGSVDYRSARNAPQRNSSRYLWSGIFFFSLFEKFRRLSSAVFSRISPSFPEQYTLFFRPHDRLARCLFFRFLPCRRVLHTVLHTSYRQQRHTCTVTRRSARFFFFDDG